MRQSVSLALTLMPLNIDAGPRANREAVRFNFIDTLLSLNIAFLTAGQSAAITGTPAWQVVIKGFVRRRMSPVKRRLQTPPLAIVPAVTVMALRGDANASCDPARDGGLGALGANAAASGAAVRRDFVSLNHCGTLILLLKNGQTGRVFFTRSPFLHAKSNGSRCIAILR